MSNSKTQPSILDLGASNCAIEYPAPGEIKDVYVERLRVILADKPDLLDRLERMVTTVKTRGQILDAISELNEKWGTQEERHGMYYMVHFGLPSGERFTVKIFKDMGNALSFSSS